MNRPGDWNCRSCSHLNFQRRDSCQRCGEPRAAGGDYIDFRAATAALSSSFGGGGGFSSGPDVRPGDWYCAIGNCGAHNFASRSTCFKCGAFKNDSSAGAGGPFDADFSGAGRRGFSFAFGNGGGGGGGGSSRSGWKSGDWICTRSGCNEHNFASRMECFRCSAPRDSTTISPY